MEVGRSLSEIDSKVRILNQALRASTEQTKEFDKALKLDSKSTEAMAGKMQSLQTQIGQAAQKLALLKAKQSEARQAFESNTITEQEFNKINVAVLKAQNQLAGYNAELANTKKAQDTAKINEIASGFDNVTNSLNKAKTAASSLSKVALGLMGTLAGVVYAFVKTGDELSDLSGKYKVSAEEIQLQRNLYDRATDDAANYDAALASLGNVMTSIAKGKGTAYIEVLDRLGVSTKNADGSTRSINEVYAELMVGLSQVADETERASLAMILFGDNGLNVANVAGLTAEEIAAYNERMMELGIITSEQSEQAAAMQDRINEIKLQFMSAAAELAVSLLPAIQVVMQFLTETVIPILNTIAKWFSGLSPQQQKMLLWVLMLIVFLPKLIAIITMIIGVVKAITVALYGTAAGTGAVSAAATPLMPILWAVAAVVLVLVLLFAMLAGKSKDVTNMLKQQQTQMQEMESEYSDIGSEFEVTSEQVSANTNTDKVEIHVQIDAYGETPMSQDNAELVADILAERINKQLGGKI